MGMQMKKIVALILLFSVLFAIVPLAAPAGAEGENSYGYRAGEDGILYPGEAAVRCGLYYGTDALLSANLANEIGSGYLFGYFDADAAFHPVASTPEEKITMMKDTNMYMLSGSYYDSLPPAGAMSIGAWHVQRPERFADFAEAAEFAASLEDAFPAWIDGEYVIRCGNYTKKDAAAADAQTVGGTAVGGSSSCYTVTVTSTGRIFFEFDMSGSYPLGVLPAGASAPTTWFKNTRYFGGFEYRRISGGDINVINVVLMGDYVKGVVPYEMGTNWPVEAMKAQAICAASFAGANRHKHGSMGFDVCGTIHCQVYKGLKNTTEECSKACDQVRSLGLYCDGELCNTVYHSSNGGSTEAARNVWTTDYPYLQAVKDDYEDLDKAQDGHWTETYTGEQIRWILNAKGYDIGKVERAYVSQYTEAGNVYSVTFADGAGKSLTFSKESARTILNSQTLGKSVKSQHYTIVSSAGELDVCVNSPSGKTQITSGTMVIGAGGAVTPIADPEEVYVLSSSGVTTLTPSEPPDTGETVFTVIGSGWGHNVGMSQWGARGRAEAGWTCEEVLAYYYTGAYIAPIN